MRKLKAGEFSQLPKVTQLEDVSNLNPSLADSKTHLLSVGLLFTCLSINLYLFWGGPGEELLFIMPTAGKNLTNLNFKELST